MTTRTQVSEDWHGEYAYTAGLQAFIYGFPYIYNAQLRHDWVTQEHDPAFTPYAAVNEFWHAARLMDASYRDGGCPNNDTLYSPAWVDLRDGARDPVPPGHGRALLHLRAGRRSPPTTSTTSASAPPDAGRATSPSSARVGRATSRRRCRPSGPSPTPWVLILGRTLVDGDERRRQRARALQAQYRLTPLSLWGKDGAGVPDRRDVLDPSSRSRTRSGRSRR